MKLAYIILAHKLPDQLIGLINRLNTPNTSFFIHIDKQTDRHVYYKIVNQLSSYSNVYFVRRYASKWGSVGIVKATLSGIREICDRKMEFDHVVLLSGQCYPIKSAQDIENYLEKNKNLSFMDYHLVEGPKTKIRDDRLIYWHLFLGKFHFVFPREDMFHNSTLRKVWKMIARLLPYRRQLPLGYAPYWGYQWWILTGQCCEYINSFVKSHHNFVNFFNWVWCPDEFFFQILLLNSPFKDQIINKCLTYVDFTQRKSHNPAILGTKEYEKFMASDKLFARKFDTSVDSEVLDMIDREIS